METAYTAPTWWYDLRGLVLLLTAYRVSLWRPVRFCRAHLRARHLDLASGSGTLLRLALLGDRTPRSIVVTDVAPVMLARLHRLAASDGRLRVDVADTAHLPFPAASFQSITFLHAAHCVADLAGTCREAYRVLEPGGTFALNVLLPPTGRGAALASHVLAWGLRAGLLTHIRDGPEVVDLLQAAGFVVTSRARRGNTAELVAQR